MKLKRIALITKDAYVQKTKTIKLTESRLLHIKNKEKLISERKNLLIIFRFIIDN
jgi:hypothetical protein